MTLNCKVIDSAHGFDGLWWRQIAITIVHCTLAAPLKKSQVAEINFKPLATYSISYSYCVAPSHKFHNLNINGTSNRLSNSTEVHVHCYCSMTAQTTKWTVEDMTQHCIRMKLVAQLCGNNKVKGYTSNWESEKLSVTEKLMWPHKPSILKTKDRPVFSVTLGQRHKSESKFNNIMQQTKKPRHQHCSTVPQQHIAYLEIIWKGK